MSPSAHMRSALLLLVAAVTRQPPAVVATATHCGSPQPAEAYDYVIVGGGTAGVAIAARLCEALPHRTVALLERGVRSSDPLDLTTRAARLAFASWDSDAAQMFESLPNEETGGLPQPLVAGAALGGASAINAGQWLRPDLDEVAAWGVAGLDAGKADELLHRAEAAVQPATAPPELTQTYAEEHLAAHARLGFAVVANQSDAQPGVPSVFLQQITFSNSGERRSSVGAYLDAVWPEGACADNLDVIEGAVVSRVLTASGVATGVEFTLSNGTADDCDGGHATRLATAAAEVVLTAGPYGSPQLLQLSGIGPRRVLKAVGVDVVADLPVGTSTQARPLQPLFTAYPGQPLARENNSTVLEDPAEAAAFVAGEPSVLGVGIGATLTPLPYGYGEYSTFSPPIAMLEDTPLIFAFCMVNPTARGSLEINSTDPAMPPAVDVNYLGNAVDIETTRDCLNEYLRPVMAQWSPEFAITEVSLGEVPAESTISSSMHFVSGAPVGAVLDAELRVKGFTKLRVADASAIPQIPRSAGPMSAVYLLAERAAELLVEAEPGAASSGGYGGYSSLGGYGGGYS